MISASRTADAPTNPASSRRKRVLIVTPSFPPSSTPDSQRVRMSLPYYAEHGWDPIVLCVDANQNEAPREDALVTTVPSEIPIYRCSPVPRSFAKIFGLGNLGWRAWLALARAGRRIIRERKVDLVFFSTTQFAVLPLGRIWRRLCGTPYVIDLQDPWRTDYYARPGVRRPPGGWKYAFARAQATLLEPWTLRRLDGLITVSPDYIADLRRRYPWFERVPAEAIRFGASELDLDAARKLPSPPRRTSGVRLVYTGAAGPITPHAATLLFRALAQFREQEPASTKRIRLEFIGTSYAAAADARPTVLPIAEQYGVADLVSETPARTGHLQGLRHQTDADGLLLLGSSDSAYSPSKLYPYYLSGRPMLALVFRGSDLEKLVDTLACAQVARADLAGENAAAIASMHAFFRAALAGFPPETLPARNDALFQREYLARSLTAKQTALFDAALPSSHARLL